jgi:hypothetical protein
VSRFWRLAFSLLYRALAVVDPLVRAWWRRLPLGNVVELQIPRRTGRGTRSRLVGILRVGNGRYVGHPNGQAGWTRDLDAARRAVVVRRGHPPLAISAHRLAGGPERETAIRATGQHPFPGNLVYRLGRRHVRATGVFFRIAPLGDEESAL